METGDRVVQRKLNGSGTVVAQRVEKLATHWLQISTLLAVTAIIVLIPFTHLTAQTVGVTQTTTVEQMPVADQNRLMEDICTPAATSITSIFGDFNGIACRDATHEISRVSIVQAAQAAHALNPPLLFGFAGDDYSLSSLPTSPDSVVCNLTSWDFGKCIWDPLITFMATLFMSLGGLAIVVSGSLFDLLITHTVINFRGTLEGLGMLDSGNTIGPITHIWATFRDVANILIIGMFVFVAISTILSIENYGARKMIAKILIVAVLLNFSMFFTKITIDVSNFVAREFYKTMPGVTQSDPSQVGGSGINVSGSPDDRDVPPATISGVFMDDIGITNLWNYKDLKNLTDSQGALKMFIYALGASIFMVVVSLMLLYASFLLASRAVLLVFLLLTSSLAFASMLMPGKFAEEAWDKWYKSLLNSAVFAPLLMLFLAATLLVLKGTSVSGQGALSDYLQHPADMSNWTVPFIFIFASGMLFVSIKVANTFAGKIAGFNYAAAIPGLGLVAGSALASFGLRNTVGRAGANFAKYQAERAQRLGTDDKKFQAGMAHIMSGAGNLIGKQSFNTMKTGFGKGLAGVMGGEKAAVVGGYIKSANAAGKGGFIADRKKYNENLLKTAEAMAPTEKMQQKAREEALKNATPEQKAEINKAFEAELAAKSAATIAEKKKKDDLARIDREASKISNPPEEKAREMQDQVRTEALRASAPEVQVRHDELSKEEHALELQIEAQERANKKALQDFDNETKKWEGRVDTSYPGAALEMETRSQKRHVLETTNIANMAPLQEGIARVKTQRGELLESVIPKATLDQKIAEKRAASIAEKAAEKRATTEVGDQAIKDTKKAAEEAEKVHKKALATVVPMGALRTREENVADITHIRWQNTIPRIFGQTTGNDSVAEDVRKGVKKKGEEKKAKDALSGYLKDMESEKPKEDKPAADAKPAEESH